jgi:hypothetical protein
MTTPDYSITITASGPIYDGEASRVAHKYTDAVADRLAKEAYDYIQSRLPRVIKVFTGRYSASIHIDRAQLDRVITDYPTVYGPWLEGVGSRNFPTTRFKGYHTFRIASQSLELRAGQLAEELLHEGYLEAMQ